MLQVSSDSSEPEADVLAFGSSSGHRTAGYVWGFQVILFALTATIPSSLPLHCRRAVSERSVIIITRPVVCMDGPVRGLGVRSGPGRPAAWRPASSSAGLEPAGVPPVLSSELEVNVVKMKTQVRELVHVRS